MSKPKSRNQRAIISYFWRHASRYPFLLAGMLLTVPLGSLTNAFLPTLFTARILDRLATGHYVRGDLWGSFGSDILLIIGLATFGGVIVWRFNTYFNWKLESLVQRDIAHEVFSHLMHLSANFHANRFGGSLVSQTNKLFGAYARMADTTTYQTSSLFWSLVFTSALLWTQATLFVILLNIFVILYIICSILITGKVRDRTRKEADASNKITGHLADSVTNVMAVKSFAAIDFENKRFGQITGHWQRSFLDMMWAVMRAQNVFSGIGALVNATAIILAVASVVLFDARVATVFLIFAYTARIREQLWDFSSGALRSYNRAFGDAQAMIDILRLEPGVKDPTVPELPRINKGAILFRNMSFTHPDAGSNETLFVDFNLDIKEGEKIGLVGHSGSGKTTLTRLLLRFSDLDGGEIVIDGQNIAHITQDDLRRHIAYVPQEPLLFHRSLSENIAYGQKDPSDKAIKAAAKKAHAAEFIERLPHGYETLVGERGVKLSGGQRQRVAIARAILKDAPILVLDEATSALDSESEKLIQAALWELMEGRTAIVIAHRLSTVQKMDRIVVLEDGAIVEVGTHKELLKKKGTYAHLWSHQSGGFLED